MHFFQFLYHQFFTTPQLPKTNFANQTIIISGANRGLGLAAAKYLAQLDASRLILAVRNTSSGEEAKAAILAANPSKHPVIEVWQLDLTSYASVKAFAQRASTELDRIDALLNNAGISTRQYRLAEDNEITITTNVISTFLLTILMLPALRASAEKHNITPRISIVGSEVHNWVPFTERKAPPGQIFTTLNEKATAKMGERYFLSKLLVMFGVRALAKQMDEAGARRSGDKTKSEVVLNCPAPGFVKTDLDIEMKGTVMFRTMEAVLARKLEVGARCLVDGVAHGTDSHGAYLSECVVKNPSKFVLSHEGAVSQTRVWDEIVAKLENIEPGISYKI